MTQSDFPSNLSANNLRELAEQRITRFEPEKVDDLSFEKMARLLYELQIHQEELKIQNEELQRAQLRLKTMRDRLADLYEFAPVGYLTLDESGRIVEANLTAATFLGVDQTRLIGARFAAYCAEQSLSELNSHFEELVQCQSHCSCKLVFRKPEDQRRYFRLDSTIARETNDRTEFRVVLTDITEQEQVSQELLEKDQHLRTLANAITVLIAYLDSNCCIRFANAAFSNWFSETPVAENGMPIKEVFASQIDVDVQDYLVDAIEGHRSEFECKMQHPQHGTRDVQIMLIPDVELNGSVKGIHTLCVDVTERKFVEKRNAHYQSFLERLHELTYKEFVVYELLIRGHSNKKISLKLDIGLRTAERRKQIILQKLKVESVAELLHHLADIQGIDTLRSSDRPN